MAGLYQEPGTPDLKTNSEILSYDLNGNIDKLKRSGYFMGTSALLIDDLKYTYQGNRVISIADASLDPSGYEGGGAAIKYDDNGNMTDMQDKGISTIAYNHLNLPHYLKINNTEINYLYRADGVKLHKNGYVPGMLGRTYSTEYLDGFHYTTSVDFVQPGINPPFHDEPIIIIAVVDTDSALEQEAFERSAFAEVAKSSQSLPDFFPTAEGFYDFRQNTYIYQYKDHLGNVRVSYKRDGHTTKVLDNNDYYPFGMNHLNAFAGAHFKSTGAWENYKYNGKELQETGMYDYGWRQYVPDLGRWFTIDPLAELGITITPYRYGFNNPILYTDPFGLFEERGNALATCPTCPNTKKFQPYINDPNKVYVYNPETKTAKREIQIQEVTVTGKKKTDNQQQSIYSPLGQGNTLLSFIGTYMANLPYRRYIGTVRPNSPFTYRGARYYGNGQTFLKSESLINTGSVIKVGKGVGAGTVVIGAVLDWGYSVPQYKKDPNSPNAVSPGKASLNTGIATYGLTGVGTMPSLVYFGLDAFYPGGFNGYVNDVGSAQTELDKGVNSARPYRVNLTGAHEPK